MAVICDSFMYEKVDVFLLEIQKMELKWNNTERQLLPSLFEYFKYLLLLLFLVLVSEK